MADVSIGPHDWTHPADFCDEPDCDHITRRTCEGAEKLTTYLRKRLQDRTEQIHALDPTRAEREATNFLRNAFEDNIDQVPGLRAAMLAADERMAAIEILRHATNTKYPNAPQELHALARVAADMIKTMHDELHAMDAKFRGDAWIVKAAKSAFDIGAAYDGDFDSDGTGAAEVLADITKAIRDAVRNSPRFATELQASSTPPDDATISRATKKVVVHLVYIIAGLDVWENYLTTHIEAAIRDVLREAGQ